MLLASLGWATGTFATTRLPVPPNPFALAAVQMLTGGVVLLVVGTVLGERLDVTGVSTAAWVAWAYLSMVVTLGAFSAYAFALANLPVSTVATYAYVNPVIAVALGAFVVGERFTALQLVGAAVVLLAVVLVVSAERPSRKRPSRKCQSGVAASAGMTVQQPVETIGGPRPAGPCWPRRGSPRRARPGWSPGATSARSSSGCGSCSSIRSTSPFARTTCRCSPASGAYDRALVDDAAWAHTARRPRLLVEYWAHEASLVPVADWPLLLPGPSGVAGGSTTRRSSSRSPPSSRTCWRR